MTTKGQPACTILGGSDEQHNSGCIAVRDGKVCDDTETETATRARGGTSDDASVPALQAMPVRKPTPFLAGKGYDRDAMRSLAPAWPACHRRALVASCLTQTLRTPFPRNAVYRANLHSPEGTISFHALQHCSGARGARVRQQKAAFHLPTEAIASSTRIGKLRTAHHHL